MVSHWLAAWAPKMTARKSVIATAAIRTTRRSAAGSTSISVRELTSSVRESDRKATTRLEPKNARKIPAPAKKSQMRVTIRVLKTER